MRKINIAVDGFSSCGKSTMAKDLAREIGYAYMDSGAMYRAVTLYALDNGLIAGGQIDETALQQRLADIQISFRPDAVTRQNTTYLNNVNVEQRIRGMEVSAWVSPISALGFVREALTRLQQQMGREKGVVMDGRDIGTTVFPDAELKIFVTASPEIRAKRRYDELQAKGGNEKASLEEILENVKARDEMDQNRAVSPLRKADDAVVLDNSHLTIEEQNRRLMAEFRRVTAGS